MATHVGGRFKVTAEIIKEAKKADSSYCMIAETIERARPHAVAVTVDLQAIRYTDRKNGERYVWMTPPGAQKALIAFDQGEPVAPFTVSLRTPIQRVPIQKRGVSSASKKVTVPVKNTNKRGEFQIVGGQLPPVAVLSNRGRVRKFGLKQLKP